MIEQRDYGTFSEVHASESSLATKVVFPPSLSALMVDILQVPVRSITSYPKDIADKNTGEDLAINLWDLGSGRRIKKMLGHTASIYSLAFSAESSMLVSGGADWTVRCWDIKSSGGLPPKARENGITPRAEESYETYVTNLSEDVNLYSLQD